MDRYNKKVEEYLKGQGFRSLEHLYNSGYKDVIQFNGTYYNGWFGYNLAYIYDNGEYIVAKPISGEEIRLALYRTLNQTQHSLIRSEILKTFNDIKAFFEE